MQAIGVSRAAQDPSAISVDALTVETPQGKRPMSAAEFAALSKTDPDAYRKFLNSHQAEEERGEVDKLFNFLSRGKYE